jgi:hypothetical protein
MTDKLINLEKELKLNLKNACTGGNNQVGNTSESTNDDLSKQKLKDLLSIQLETSENFRLNTEKTLNTIKEEFQQMVMVIFLLYNK